MGCYIVYQSCHYLGGAGQPAETQSKWINCSEDMVRPCNPLQKTPQIGLFRFHKYRIFVRFKKVLVGRFSERARLAKPTAPRSPILNTWEWYQTSYPTLSKKANPKILKYSFKTKTVCIIPGKLNVLYIIMHTNIQLPRAGRHKRKNLFATIGFDNHKKKKYFYTTVYLLFLHFYMFVSIH